MQNRRGWFAWVGEEMKAVSFVLGVALCCGTASAQTLTSDAMTQYQGAPLTTVTYEMAEFAPYTVGKAALGIFGAFAILSTGKRSSRKTGFPIRPRPSRPSWA